MSVVAGLEPKLLWKHFDELRKIPRSSGHEEGAARYVLSVANELGLDHKQDSVNNVLVNKPGSAGHKDARTVVLQSHLDMVCEKNSDKQFDFSKDAIELVLVDDWLTADGTSLGADDGMGVAAALSILEDNSLVHGPLEVLFTVDEERGLNGARSLSPMWLKGRTLINLDSEDLGVFSIGCAGGADSFITLPVKWKRASGDTLLKLHLHGLRGGHSGVDIHEGRGNAVKLLNRLIWQLNKEMPLELARIDGGDKHNAIPREVMANVVVSSSDVPAIREWFGRAVNEVEVELKPVEKNIVLEVQEQKERLPQVLDTSSQVTLLALLFALPHGPMAMSRTVEGLVETSNNVASIRFENDNAVISCSSRSSNDAVMKATRDQLVAIAQMAGADIELPAGYPGWMPNLDSEVLKISLDTFKEVTGNEARYEAIHAGLECGLIGEKFPGMDMISVGPTVQHPHSPDERVHLRSVKDFYRHVLRMLEVLA